MQLAVGIHYHPLHPLDPLHPGAHIYRRPATKQREQRQRDQIHREKRSPVTQYVRGLFAKDDSYSARVQILSNTPVFFVDQRLFKNYAIQRRRQPSVVDYHKLIY